MAFSYHDSGEIFYSSGSDVGPNFNKLTRVIIFDHGKVLRDSTYDNSIRSIIPDYMQSKQNFINFVDSIKSLIFSKIDTSNFSFDLGSVYLGLEVKEEGYFNINKIGENGPIDSVARVFRSNAVYLISKLKILPILYAGDTFLSDLIQVYVSYGQNKFEISMHISNLNDIGLPVYRARPRRMH